MKCVQFLFFLTYLVSSRWKVTNLSIALKRLVFSLTTTHNPAFFSLINKTFQTGKMKMKISFVQILGFDSCQCEIMALTNAYSGNVWERNAQRASRISTSSLTIPWGWQRSLISQICHDIKMVQPTYFMWQKNDDSTPHSMVSVQLSIIPPFYLPLSIYRKSLKIHKKYGSLIFVGESQHFNQHSTNIMNLRMKIIWLLFILMIWDGWLTLDQKACGILCYDVMLSSLFLE